MTALLYSLPIIIPILLILICLYLARSRDESNILTAIFFVSSMCFMVALIMLPYSRYITGVAITKYKKTQMLYSNCKEHTPAMVMEIQDINEALVRTQKLSNGIFGLYYPREVRDLKPIQ